MFKIIKIRNLVKSSNFISLNRSNFNNNYRNINFKENRLFSSSNSITDKDKINFQNDINNKSFDNNNNTNSNNINNNENKNNQDNNNNNNNNYNNSNNNQDNSNNNNNNNNTNSNNSNNNSNNDNNYKNSYYNKRLKFDKDFRILLLKSLGIMFLVRTYVVELTYCQGTSMEPTINTGDFIFINKLSKDYKVGDLITAACPTNQFSICKRIRFVVSISKIIL
ncbi:hypothetical protein ACTFIR_009851 [Dictyostelium discoideum]